MTQNEMVLELLKDPAVTSLTAAYAMTEIGCFRLASRINDLRKAGHKIITHFETKHNRFGKPVSFARYELGTAVSHP